MNTFAGKTAAQWIDLLGSHLIHERCAAALALAEFEPNSPPVKNALLPALHDLEKSVQIAVQIGIGFIYVPVENRRRMLNYLLGPDNDDFRGTLKALHDLAFSNLLGTASKPDDQMSETGAADHKSQPMPISPAGEIPELAAPVPDIAKVHLFPWVILLTGFLLCLGLAWLLRSVSWSRWVFAVIGAVAALFLFVGWSRKQSGSLLPKRFQSQARIAWSAVFSAACGLAVTLCFPTSLILIDNATVADVLLRLDDQDWVEIRAGESTSKALIQGKHRLAIRSVRGNQLLDALDVEVAGHEKYVLNVLNAQVYFQGTVQYGINGFEMKVVTEKWFLLPAVDYLFEDPPARILSAHPVNKTFFTKGVPPKLKG